MAALPLIAIGIASAASPALPLVRNPVRPCNRHHRTAARVGGDKSPLARAGRLPSLNEDAGPCAFAGGNITCRRLRPSSQAVLTGRQHLIAASLRYPIKKLSTTSTINNRNNFCVLRQYRQVFDNTGTAIACRSSAGLQPVGPRASHLPPSAPCSPRTDRLDAPSPSASSLDTRTHIDCQQDKAQDGLQHNLGSPTPPPRLSARGGSAGAPGCGLWVLLLQRCLD